MRRLFMLLVMSFILVTLPLSQVRAYSATEGEEVVHRETTTAIPHTWKKTSSDFEMVHANTHEYTVWHNFIKKTRKCDVTYKIRTDIWYCNLHNHTKSEVSLEETIHSNKHS